MLKALFIKLEETQEPAISPEYELAYMALLNEKDDDTATEVQTEETPIDTKEETLIDTKETFIDTKETFIDAKEDTDMVDATELVSDKTEPVDDTNELADALQAELTTNTTELTDPDVENSFRRTSFTSEIPPPNSPPPSYVDIASVNTEPHFEDEKSAAVEPPKLKERPSVDTMMFGKQQDVTGTIFFFLQFFMYLPFCYRMYG